MLGRLRRAPRAMPGFALIEALVSILIVGFGVTGLMFLLGAQTRVNAAGSRLATAVLLAEQVRCMTDTMAFDDLFGLDGWTGNGVDAGGNVIPGWERYEQSLAVDAVNADNLTPYVGADPPAARLTARVSCGGTELYAVSWLRVP